jgi:hypothetical protein
MIKTLHNELAQENSDYTVGLPLMMSTNIFTLPNKLPYGLIFQVNILDIGNNIDLPTIQQNR